MEIGKRVGDWRYVYIKRNGLYLRQLVLRWVSMKRARFVNFLIHTERRRKTRRPWEENAPDTRSRHKQNYNQQIETVRYEYYGIAYDVCARHANNAVHVECEWHGSVPSNQQPRPCNAGNALPLELVIPRARFTLYEKRRIDALVRVMPLKPLWARKIHVYL